MGTTGSKLASDLEQMDLGTGNNNNSCRSSSQSPSQQQAQPGTSSQAQPPLLTQHIDSCSDKHHEHQSPAQNQLFVLTSAASSLSPVSSHAQQSSPPGPHIIIKADPDQQSNSRDEANHTEQPGESAAKNSGFSDTEHKSEEVSLFLLLLADDSF